MAYTNFKSCSSLISHKITFLSKDLAVDRADFFPNGFFISGLFGFFLLCLDENLLQIFSLLWFL